MILFYNLIDIKYLVGILLGCLSMMRITFLPLTIFLFILKKYKIFTSYVVTVTSIFIISSFLMGKNIWIDYFKNVNDWQKIQTGELDSKKYDYKKDYPFYSEGFRLKIFYATK